MHTCGGYNAHVLRRHNQRVSFIRFEHNDKINGLGLLLRKQHAWITVLFSHWSGTQQASPYPKNVAPRDTEGAAAGRSPCHG